MKLILTGRLKALFFLMGTLTLAGCSGDAGGGDGIISVTESHNTSDENTSEEDE